jgi:hypothetical protein
MAIFLHQFKTQIATSTLACFMTPLAPRSNSFLFCARDLIFRTTNDQEKTEKPTSSTFSKFTIN